MALSLASREAGEHEKRWNVAEGVGMRGERVEGVTEGSERREQT